ncbi:hypothetical protein DSO57_1026901 [Entomophthora muscae]|uniref:Uncharacterized protein n=1 Tax=Entomophthora muscae TaxID=34485 RepID=A0ACC2UMF6_9FUNG|nr:hypothetical protein DSO57_1026901 [Entomophthora muscae]
MNSTSNTSDRQSMRQAYSTMMATMGEAERNAFCRMPCSVRIAFLNCLFSSKDQFCEQDCATTVAGSVPNSALSSDAGDLFEEDSLFDEPSPVPSTPPVCDPSGALRPFLQCLPSSGEPPATPLSMLCAWRNLDKVLMDYPNLLSKFSVCHHKKTMFSFVQAIHSNEDAMSPICASKLYHGQYDAFCLAAEVRLGLQSASLAPGQISPQHAHTIAICNSFIDEVVRIWALELAADPAFHQTLDLPIQDNSSRRFSATFKVFLLAVSTGDASLYFPLAAARLWGIKPSASALDVRVKRRLGACIICQAANNVSFNCHSGAYHWLV